MFLFCCSLCGSLCSRWGSFAVLNFPVGAPQTVFFQGLVVPLVYPHIVPFSLSPNSASLLVLREVRVVYHIYRYFLRTVELCLFVAVSFTM